MYPTVFGFAATAFIRPLSLAVDAMYLRGALIVIGRRPSE
jgi:hypothetical protein